MFDKIKNVCYNNKGRCIKQSPPPNLHRAKLSDSPLLIFGKKLKNQLRHNKTSAGFLLTQQSHF